MPADDRQRKVQETLSRVAEVSRELGKHAGEVAGQAGRAVVERAQQSDLIGQAAYRTLSAVHKGAGMVARQLSRLERATAPPSRGQLVRTDQGSRRRSQD